MGEVSVCLHLWWGDVGRNNGIRQKLTVHIYLRKCLSSLISDADDYDNSKDNLNHSLLHIRQHKREEHFKRKIGGVVGYKICMQFTSNSHHHTTSPQQSFASPLLRKSLHPVAEP
jgi:hypothetical protein